MRARALFYPLLLISAGLLAYAQSLAGAFIFDDFSCVVENPHLRHLWPLWDAVTARPETALAGRPVVALSIALNYALGGLDVRGYHVVNVMLHVCAALLLFGIIRRTLGRSTWRSRFGDDATWLACSAALLWMVHPLLTDGVTYVIQRTELLMSVFLLATLYSVIRSANAGHPGRWQATAIFSCALGMASKEVMVSAPLLVWLYDRTFLAGSFRDALQRRRGLYLGLAGTWLILAGLLVTGARTTTAGLHAAGATPWEYAMTQSGVMLHYLRLAIWPHPLVSDYSDWPIARTMIDVAPSMLLMTGLLLGTVWALRRRPPLGFLGAWFLLILAPSSSFLPIVTEPAAERRMYLPLAALVALAVLGGWEALRRLKLSDSFQRRLAVGCVTILAAAFGIATIERNAVYGSELTLLRDVIVKRPRNAHAYYNLGLALVEQSRREDAASAFRDALRIQPDYAEAHSNLGVLLTEQGRFDEAIAHYQEALRLKPDLANAANNLALALRLRHGAAGARHTGAWHLRDRQKR